MNVTIFSKDRACQLDLLLRSMEKYFEEFEETKIEIIYTFSNEDFENGYKKLYKKYNNVKFIRETNFKNDVIESISKNEMFTMFLVDDIIFKNHFSLEDLEFKTLKDNNEILCISLRLSKHSNYCFALNSHMILPPTFSINQWVWMGASGDFGYPMSLDGHVFRTNEILSKIKSIEFKCPNELEGLLASNQINAPKMLCYEDSILINNACNRTQNVIKNRSGNMNLDDINNKFLNGYIIDMEPFNMKNNPSCHINVDMNFVKKYDIVIVSHEIDFYKIKYIIEKLDDNLEFEEIHLILSDRGEYREKELIEKMTSRPIFYHNEIDILKIEKDKIKHRPNWIYQMMLKFFQNVTKNDNYLIIESDTVIISKLNFFEDGKTIFYLGMDQNHQQYFNFSKKILGLDREFNHSFISEFMMYNKNVIKELLKKSNCGSIEDFLKLLYENIDKNCYPADYELYGNFCYKYFKDDYLMRKLKSKSTGRHQHWEDEEIKSYINSGIESQLESVSFHTYK